MAMVKVLVLVATAAMVKTVVMVATQEEKVAGRAVEEEKEGGISYTHGTCSACS